MEKKKKDLPILKYSGRKYGVYGFCGHKLQYFTRAVGEQRGQNRMKIKNSSRKCGHLTSVGTLGKKNYRLIRIFRFIFASNGRIVFFRTMEELFL